MIRIALTTDDLERLRVADLPDFGNELTLGGAVLAHRAGGRNLAAWRLEAARGWNPGHSRLFDLYTHVYMPPFFDRVAQPKPSLFDPASAPATAHLRDLARSGALTPFTRALADGHPGALGTLDRILAAFRATALDPYHRRITSVVATAAATAAARAAIGGPGAMLGALHPSIRLDGRELRLNTVFDAEESLEQRPLILQPTALATRITFNPLADSVIVSYPAGAGPLTRDPRLDAPPQALVSLLGATRAAALVAVARRPGLTTGQLAAALGVSDAAASRHAAVLRRSRLIVTLRDGQTVHHAPTRLGTDLMHGSIADDQAEREPERPSAAGPATAAVRRRRQPATG